MCLARFEIECKNPEIVRRSVELDDSSTIKYTVEEDKLILEIEADSLSSLMKIAYSVCNRIQLSIDTIEKFGENSC